MNTNKIFHHIVGMLAVSGSLFMASCDYLDVIPTEQADTKDMVIDNLSALKMLYSCYSYMQQPQNNAINYEAIEGENDETVCPQEWGSMGQKAQWNAITPSSINGSSSYPWVYLYNGIGYCNQFLELLKDNNPDLTPQAKAQYEAEATFLKAYYHFRALELYGPIPIIDTKQSSNISKSELPGRSHFDYCVNYIDSLLDEASTSLPESYDDPNSYGRATSVACKALKARLLLYAASPLWNGSFPNRSWKNTNYQTPGYGYELVSHEYDANKWVKAREATLEAIKAAEGIGCKLLDINTSEQVRTNQNVPLPAIPGKEASNTENDNFKKRVMLMRYVNCALPDQGNTETIWGYYINLNYWHANVPHFVLINDLGNRHGSWGGLSPTLFTVEHFFTENGLQPAEDPKFTKEADWFKSANAAQSSNIINLNMNREPRFYAWITFDGDQYSPVIAARKPLICNMRDSLEGGYNATLYGRRNYSVTGFLSKKFTHPNYYYTGVGTNNNISSCSFPWPVIRLAELYLNLAECDAHLGDAYTTEALTYLNKIRERAGVPDVTTSTLKETGKTLLQTVLDERFVELYKEGHRYYDIRRYVQGSKYLSSNCFKGLDAIRMSPTFVQFNTPTKIDQPFAWNDREYLLPVSNNEVYANPQMVQAPGY